MSRRAEGRAKPRKRRGRPARARWWALLACSLLALGCQTTRSFQHECPGVYSGVRYYGDQIGGVPFDGKLFFTIDLPLSAVVDTLLLPVTSFIDRPPKPEGYPPGCRWAQ